ncbi:MULTISPECIES: O-antigen ligase family protein [unclassified Brevibacillus]|uniref:O-antigen ligase family protein n=1 Tax=unclassified Brevibacillus TaxID=2684853 RepID=UPI00356633F1
MEKVISWISYITLSIVFIFTPYLRGLFFDADIYITELIIMGLFFIFATSILIRRNEQDNTLIYLVVMLLPLSHVISLAVALTPKGALDNTFRWFSYAAFFMIIIWTRHYFNKQNLNHFMEKSLSCIFQFSGIWIALYALFGLWGLADFQDITLGYRLAGFFQYPNTLAAVVGAYWIYTLLKMIKEDISNKEVFILSLPLVVYGLCFFFTYSRGAMVVLPIAWLFSLLLLKPRQQLKYTLFTFTSLVASVLSFELYTTIIDKNNSSLTIASLIAFSLLVAVLNILVNRTNRKVSNLRIVRFIESKKYANYAIPGALFLLLGLIAIDLLKQGLVYKLLPEGLQNRISLINFESNSFIARSNFLQDAFSFSKNSPFIGWGGEGWRFLFTQYQQIPYWSNEVHNGYLEMLLSVGWVGLLIFMFVMGFFLYQMLTYLKIEVHSEKRTQIIASIGALSMLFIHACIDFDFSFGTVWFIVFWILGMSVPIEPKVAWNNISVKWKKVALALCTVSIMIFFVYTIKFFVSDQITQGIGTNEAVSEMKKKLEEGALYNPYRSEIWLDLANMEVYDYRVNKSESSKTNAVNYSMRALELEPQNASLYHQVGTIYLSLGAIDKAFQNYQKAVNYDRFHVKYREQIMILLSNLAVDGVKNKAKDATFYADEAIKEHKEYKAVFDKYRSESVHDKRPLELSQDAKFLLAQSYVINKEYSEALELLLPICSDSSSSMYTDAVALLVNVYETMEEKAKAKQIVVEMTKSYPVFPQKVVEFREIFRK